MNAICHKNLPPPLSLSLMMLKNEPISPSFNLMLINIFHFLSSGKGNNFCSFRKRLANTSPDSFLHLHEN
jgi:hypothetical protein